MGKVLLEMGVAVDGYVAGPDITPESPLGRDGERLHEWMFAGRSSAESQRFETDHFEGIGALILGRRITDMGVGPWGDEPTFHAPCFVVTHRPPKRSSSRVARPTSSSPTGIENALQRAQGAAGSQDVLVNGGADIAPPVPQRRAARRGPPPSRAGGAGRRHTTVRRCEPRRPPEPDQRDYQCPSHARHVRSRAPVWRKVTSPRRQVP